MSLYLGTQITNALIALLETIRTEEGNRTDIGYRVYVNQPISNRHEVPCCVLLEGNETGIPRAAGLIQTEMDFQVGAYVFSSDTTSNSYAIDPSADRALLGDLMADIRETLESKYCALSIKQTSLRYVGASRFLQESGGEIIGVELRYIVQFGAEDGDFCNAP